MLWIDDEFRPAFERLGLISCESIAQFFKGDAAPENQIVWLRSKTLPTPQNSPLSVFYKEYRYRRPSWKFLGRSSKARCEFRNYGVFARLGIPSAARIACGEQRDWLGRLCRAFIITRAIPDATTLPEFIEANAGERAGAVRATLSAQLAAMTRKIHDAGFFHHDLVWRNILVTWTPPAAPQLWWIDCPRGEFARWPLLHRRRRMKDLASLDKVASRLCRRRERIAFVKLYLGIQQLDRDAKKLIRDTLAYRKRRWPDDWK
jgi:hypothetical protein